MFIKSHKRELLGQGVEAAHSEAVPGPALQTPSAFVSFPSPLYSPDPFNIPMT